MQVVWYRASYLLPKMNRKLLQEKKQFNLAKEQKLSKFSNLSLFFLYTIRSTVILFGGTFLHGYQLETRQ